MSYVRACECLDKCPDVRGRAAPYFRDCLSAQDLDELNIEIIRNTVRYRIITLESGIAVLTPWRAALPLLLGGLPLVHHVARSTDKRCHVAHPQL